MTKSVFVVTIAQVDDYEDLGVRTEVFANYEDAVTYLKEWRDDEIQYVSGDDWVIENDNADIFTACLVGDWARSHSEGYIEEKEIR